MKNFVLFAVLCALNFTCGSKKTTDEHRMNPPDSVYSKGTFGFDLAFLKEYKEVIVLGDSASPAKVVVIPDYQGRVMTSTAMGAAGNSYGWINYDLIQSGKTPPHINPVGGEDRFWLGPEGGQNSIYFKKGDPFDFDHWQTPPLIDSEPFELVSANANEAIFRKASSLTNYQGYEFNFEIRRSIKLLRETDIEREFGVATGSIHAVSFESDNAITNSGKLPWIKKNGLLSIWILGMYTPTDETTIIFPHEASTGKGVTDSYFGTIPSDRILKSDSLLLLKADGKYRGKVGIAPAIAKNIAGSYDAGRHILTLVKFDIDKHGSYVNSKWELQQSPFAGDAVNGYNDGPLAGGGQLGPFYELESSSPARELAPGETLSHRHITVHLEGDELLLNEIAIKTLGVSLREVRGAFGEKSK